MANLWLSFLNDVQDKARNEISQELLDEPLIKEAIEYLEESSYTKEERLEYDRYWDIVSSGVSALDDAETRGIAIGRIEGRAEGRIEGRIEGREEGAKQKNLENARKMKQKGFSAEDISDITGLSVEEIEGIKTEGI